MQTQREFQLALSKLLNHVKVQNSWSIASFEKCAKSSGVTKSEASRFYKALVEMDLLRFDKQRKAMIANFNVAVWQNEDTKLGLIRDIMEIFPLKQQRGRVKGKAYPVKAKTMAEVAIVAEADINPLSQFSAADLVAELRRRNYEVTARKQVITVEEL